MLYNLFLDDMRQHPSDVYQYIQTPVVINGKDVYNELKWIVVKNYNEFVELLNKNGLPNIISFDHDLAPEHYTPTEYWNDYNASKTYQLNKYPTYKEKTGLDCMNYLLTNITRLNKKNDFKIPIILYHTQNPVGEDLMREYFENFQQNFLNLEY